MIETKKLESFGAEILGINISDTAKEGRDDDAIKEIRDVWMQHGVVVFRDQGEISETDLVKFSRLFGELEIHIRAEYLSRDNPEILYVSNIQNKDENKPIGILSDHEVGWHHDQIYLQKPALGSLLHGVTIPPTGGNTEFVSLQNAYDALDDDMKKRLAGLKAVQSYSFFNGTWSEPTSNTQTERTPDVEHPLIRTHPETGRKAIYADPGMTPMIAGLETNESRELLDFLFQHATQQQFRYNHQWRLGDAIMWDNASTMHRRGEFDSSSQRLMKRTTILPPTDRAIPI